MELVSISIWVWKRLFSSVFRTTVSARAAKVIRLAREAQSEDVAEARIGFGVVNNGSKSLSSIFATKRTQSQLWTLPGSFFESISSCFELQDPPGDLQVSALVFSVRRRGRHRHGGTEYSEGPGLQDQIYIGIYIFLQSRSCRYLQ